jgi:hypothetical protein
MTELLRQFVRERARHRCEYCLLHQDDSPWPRSIWKTGLNFSHLVATMKNDEHNPQSRHPC